MLSAQDGRAQTVQGHLQKVMISYTRDEGIRDEAGRPRAVRSGDVEAYLEE